MATQHTLLDEGSFEVNFTVERNRVLVSCIHDTGCPITLKLINELNDLTRRTPFKGTNEGFYTTRSRARGIYRWLRKRGMTALVR